MQNKATPVVEAILEVLQHFSKINTSKYLKTLCAKLDPIISYLNLRGEKNIDSAFD